MRTKYVLNLDIQDFFPPINFGRVRGLFLAKPYEFPPPVATVLAQICCHNNQLPQGAPTSPVISNMLCSRLDKQLQDLAVQHGCYYTRYADDITFSTSRNRFPADLAFVETVAEGARAKIGTKLHETILGNGFKVNPEKTRLEVRGRRLNVTGLVVNQFVNVDRRYIRQVRAILHAWEKYGLAAANKTYAEKFDKKSRFPGKAIPSLVQVVQGKIQYIGAIKGWDNGVYKRLRDNFNFLSPVKIRVSHDSWFVNLFNSCWVIEDEEDIIQGTAFFLEATGW